MSNSQDLQDRARKAAVEFANSQSVGDFIEVLDEGDNVNTYFFESKLKGYVGWRIAVSVFTDEATISEVNLLPGDDALLAPKWVPWSERLADYKALQAELEAQAAAEAEEAEEGASDDADETDDAAEEVQEAEASADSADDSAAPVLSEESVDAEENSDDAGKRPPRFLRRRLGRLKYKKDKS
jgi:hypothetical protein